MYKEVKKVLAYGVILSSISWSLILNAIDMNAFTPIYSIVVITAFLGAMFILYGIDLLLAVPNKSGGK
jgi:heme/copper-type cytochrome/quinol oxidase subunit 3